MASWSRRWERRSPTSGSSDYRYGPIPRPNEARVCKVRFDHLKIGQLGKARGIDIELEGKCDGLGRLGEVRRK